MRNGIERLVAGAGLGVLSAAVLVWTLLPLYHMLVLSLTPVGERFAGRLWPTAPTLDNYRIVLQQDNYYLSRFWVQFGNSVFVAVATCAIVLACSLTASFAITRLRPRFATLASNLALTTYLVPATFLAIPFYQVMTTYGLLGSRWALILTMSTFATPYAIWVLQQNAGSVPMELDEAAKIDGATPFQIFCLVYIPLMAPTMVAVGAFAMMLAWNEYLYAFLLLSDENHITIPVMLGQFITDDSAPWPLLMTSGVLYALPPTLLYFAVRGFMAAGLTSGSVKG